MNNPDINPKLPLTDHAFTVRAQSDPDFRQALVLDPEAALTHYSISSSMRNKIKSALRLLDRMLLVLAQNWTCDDYLRQILGGTEVRRILLFAPCQSSSSFGLHRQASDELMQLSDMAGTIFEALLLDWSP